jgi:hypothetical protein
MKKISHDMHSKTSAIHINVKPLRKTSKTNALNLQEKRFDSSGIGKAVTLGKNGLYGGRKHAQHIYAPRINNK